MKNVSIKILTIVLIFAIACNSIPVTPVSAKEITDTKTPSEIPPLAADMFSFPTDTTHPQVDFSDTKATPTFVKQNPVVEKLTKKLYRSDEEVTVAVSNTQDQPVNVEVLDVEGKKAPVAIEQTKTMTETIIAIEPTTQFRPGKYKLVVTNKDGFRSEQDFRWGVLAINTNRSIYQAGQTVNLSIAVLNDKGDMVCDAKVELKISHTKEDILSTDNGKIVTNPQCTSHNFSLEPDYEATYQVGEPGVYAMTLTAQTSNGTYTITDMFQVEENVAFDIERVSATRIYPPNDYPVTFNITANQDFEGTITETVPEGFSITPSKTNSYDTAQTLYLEKQDDPSQNIKKDVLGEQTSHASMSGLLLPFAGAYAISQGFGQLNTADILSNFYAKYTLSGHDGVDFAIPENTPIFAVDDGNVILAGDGDYGTTVVLQHDWGKSYYGHLNKITVNKDTSIKKGTQIGFSGNTGESTGPHLHFGMKPNDPDIENGYYGKVDPLPYFNLPSTSTFASNLGSVVTQSTVLGASTSAVLSASTSATPQFTVNENQLRKDITLQGNTVNEEKVKVIQWHVRLKKGEKTTLSYQFKAPLVSPQFYLLGPLSFYSNTNENGSPVFQEQRQWQIAADAVGTSWYNDGTAYGGYNWQYRKQIAIDHTKVSANNSVLVDATSNQTNTSTNVSSFSFSHTTGSQSNRYMIVAVWISRQGATIATPTYNGQSLTLLGTVNLNTNIGQGYIYGLSNPPSGTANVSFSSISPSSSYEATAATFYNVGSVGTPVSNTNGNVASTSPNTGAITTVPGSVVYDAMATMASSGTITVGGSQTSVLIAQPSTGMGGGFSYQTASGTSTTNSWTTSSSGIYADIGVALNPTAGGGTISDFPVLVNLSSDSDVQSHAQSTGNDILFTDENGNKLNHEIEKYNNSTGETVAWVEIPSLSSSTDTTIYMYYGNQSASNQQNATAVWDTNYKGVWHLSETPSAAAQDSTSDNYDGTVTGMEAGDQVAGQIDGSLVFDGTTAEFIDIGKQTNLYSNTAYTASCWIKRAGTGSERHFFSNYNSGATRASYDMFVTATNTVGLVVINNGPSVAIQSTTTLNTTNWYYITAVWSGTTGTIYVNGTSEASGSNASAMPTFINVGNTAIGRPGSFTSANYNGTIDECRFSTTNRSSNWITTEYNNQSSPSTFYSLGQEETKNYATAPDTMMRHGRFFNSSGDIQPFIF